MDDKLITLPDAPSDTVPTKYWVKLDDGRIECTLCPRACKLRNGQRGLCFIRKAQDDQIVMTSYGRSSGFCIDPIEKKPLNHFLPGTPVLSLGTAGCNLACSFCQNWDISKAREMDKIQDLAQPEMIAKAAKETGCRSVAFTYNDPVIFMEYAIDIAQACHELDIKTVAVTAGYINEEPRKEFFKYMDAANVDLKAFSEDFYWRETKGALKPVLDTLVYLKEHTQTWFEITTLLIPDENDSSQEIREQCQWIIDHLGPDVPIHFSAFHPDYKMRDKQRTPLATLIRARDIALETGIHYVYTGNVHNKSGDTTCCHHCGHELIVRDWYQIEKWQLNNDGTCPNCGTKIPGVFDGPAGNWGRKRVPIRIGSQNDRQNLVKVAPPQSKRTDTQTVQKNRTYQPNSRTNYKIMKPQVAGMFYPENPSILAAEVDKLLDKAPKPPLTPKAIIAPHAGYRYSGEIAAHAYNALGKHAADIRKVVLFGPPHRAPVRGIAVPSHQQFMTPLGPVDIDTDGVDKLLQLDFVQQDDTPFAGEHGLEVHLPFLQRVLENFEIIPALVGATTPEQVAQALETVWGGDETLILISSDLSHFYDYDKARKLDNAAAVSIETLRPDMLGEEQACGRHAIRGLLLEAGRHNLRPTTIDLRNSGDTAGNPERVVGYGAFTFEPADTAKTPPEMANILLSVAQKVIIEGAKQGRQPKLTLRNIPRLLLTQRSTFTTITINGQLRGCRGSIVPHRPMINDVAENAYQSAFNDPRFAPMNQAEIEAAEISISVLAIPYRFPIKDEADLVAKVTPGKDGLIFCSAGRQGLFLPSVWEQIPEPENFIRHLKNKAGLPMDYWADDVEIYRFTAEKIGPVPLIQEINTGDINTQHHIAVPNTQTDKPGLFSRMFFQSD